MSEIGKKFGSQVLEEGDSVLKDILSIDTRHLDVESARNLADRFAHYRYTFANINTGIFCENDQDPWMVKALKLSEAFHQAYIGDWVPMRMELQQQAREYIALNDWEMEKIGTNLAFLSVALMDTQSKVNGY